MFQAEKMQVKNVFVFSLFIWLVTLFDNSVIVTHYKSGIRNAFRHSTTQDGLASLSLSTMLQEISLGLCQRQIRPKGSFWLQASVQGKTNSWPQSGLHKWPKSFLSIHHSLIASISQRVKAIMTMHCVIMCIKICTKFQVSMQSSRVLYFLRFQMICPDNVSLMVWEYDLSWYQTSLN